MEIMSPNALKIRFNRQNYPLKTPFFFAHPFFLFLPTPPRRFPCQNSPISGATELLVLVENGELAETGFWGGCGR